MKRDDVVIIGVVGTTLTVVAGCFAVGPRCFFDALSGQTMAAWVQAFGSIAAIWGAWWLANRQERADLLLRRHTRIRAKLEMAEAVLSVAEDAETVLNNVHDKLSKSIGSFVTMPIERLEELQFTIRTLVGKDIDVGLMRSLFEIQREIAYTMTAARELEGGFVSEDRSDQAGRRARKVRTVVIRISSNRNACAKSAQTLADYEY